MSTPSPLRHFFRAALISLPFILIAFVATEASPVTADLGAISGAGNITVGADSQTTTNSLNALQTIGAKMARANIYPSSSGDNGSGTYVVNQFDSQMLQFYQSGVTPVLLLEWYATYKNSPTSYPFGNYAKWKLIGQEFAQRYRPGGTWSQANGAGSNFGITTYTAFNEPDGSQATHFSTSEYHDALQGLADGVHSIDASLLVDPGGFTGPNLSGGDFSLGGYGSAISDLYNNGTLDAMDLHTYYGPGGTDYLQPLDFGRYGGGNVPQFSAQSAFDLAKQAAGITRDIGFASSEFNFSSQQTGAAGDALRAQGFLTGFWDNVGVVGNDGHTSVTRYAFPFTPFSAISDAPYGTALQVSPFVMDSRAAIWKKTLSLTSGMSLTTLNPPTINPANGSSRPAPGTDVLTGNGKKLWVWQDRPYWNQNYQNNYYSTPNGNVFYGPDVNQFTVSNIPAGTTSVQVYASDGMRQSVSAVGQGSITVTGLPGDETYMFLASTPIQTDTPSAQTGQTVVVHLTGSSTNWNSGTQFSLDGGNGASISSQMVTDATHATLSITTGDRSGPLNISDPGYVDSTQLSVQGAPYLTSIMSGPTNSSSSTITWNSSLAGSSQINFGPSNGLGITSSLTDTGSGVIAHSLTLSGLQPCVSYFYQVRTANASDGSQIGTSSTRELTTSCLGNSVVQAEAVQSVPTSGGSIILSGNGGSLVHASLSSGFAAQSATVQAHQLISGTVNQALGLPTATAAISNTAFSLAAVAADGSLINSFSQPATVTLAYDPSALPADITDSDLLLFSNSSGSWQAVSGCTISTQNHTIACPMSTFATVQVGFAVRIPFTLNFPYRASNQQSATGVMARIYATGSSSELATVTNQVVDANSKMIITDSSFLSILNNTSAYDIRLYVPGFAPRLITNITNVLAQPIVVGTTPAWDIGDFNGDNRITVGDIVSTIGAHNNHTDTAALFATQIFGHTPTIGDLVKVIYNYNHFPNGS